MKNNKLLTATQIAKELDITVNTLTNWYKWYTSDEFEKPEGTPELPCYQQDGPRSVRYWHESDLEQLKLFKRWLPHGRNGVMGAYNKKYWSKAVKKSN